MTDGTSRPLAGHSGVDLLLVQTGGATIVRKSARLPAQNDRLRAQCEKLTAAHRTGLPCPRVLRDGLVKGLYEFEMEYLAGETLANAIIQGRELDWQRVAGSLSGFIMFYRGSARGDIPSSSFHAKLGAIAAQCRDTNVVGALAPRLEAIIARLGAMSWSGIQQSDCHGDFTLENIILQGDDRLALIDFDVPEHASWALDIGKLYQDVLGQWCLRHIALADAGGTRLLNAQMRLRGAAQALDAAILPLLPGGAARRTQLVAFHLLRTLPYARAADIAAYVIARLEHLLA